MSRVWCLVWCLENFFFSGRWTLLCAVTHRYRFHYCFSSLSSHLHLSSLFSRFCRQSFLLSLFSLCLRYPASRVWGHAFLLPSLVHLVFRLYSRRRHQWQRHTGDKLSHLCCWHGEFVSKWIQRVLRGTTCVSQWFANGHKDSVFYIRTITQRQWLRRLRACCGLM